jgi:hypothetical protein
MARGLHSLATHQNQSQLFRRIVCQIKNQLSRKVPQLPCCSIIHLEHRSKNSFIQEVQFFVKESVLSLTKVYDSYSKIEVTELLLRYENTFKNIINEDTASNVLAAKIAAFDHELK